MAQCLHVAWCMHVRAGGMVYACIVPALGHGVSRLQAPGRQPARQPRQAPASPASQQAPAQPRAYSLPGQPAILQCGSQPAQPSALASSHQYPLSLPTTTSCVPLRQAPLHYVVDRVLLHCGSLMGMRLRDIYISQAEWAGEQAIVCIHKGQPQAASLYAQTAWFWARLALEVLAIQGDTAQ